MSKIKQEEFITLIQKQEKIIHKVIHLYIDEEEDRKDLFQEILLQAWKSYPKFKGQSAFSTWLYRVALNTVFNFQKKEQKKKELIAIPEENTTTNTTAKETHELLYLEIKKLEPVNRTLITLHLDGYKNQEIAEILGMTSNHVNVKIHRLKNQIVNTLKKNVHGLA